MVDEHLNDWVLFAEEVLGVFLDDEQKAILRSVQHNPKTVVKSGTSRGKDFVTAVACICFLYLTPYWDDKEDLIGNTKVAMTAPTGRQVENIMAPEISRLVIRARKRGFNLPGRLTVTDIRMEEKEWFLTGFKADDHNTESWTGFHAVNTMFAVTEASGMPELVWNAIEGNLQGNSRLLIVFNDNTGSGYAASAMKMEGWSKFRLDSLNAPNVVQKAYVIPGQVDWKWVNDRVKEWCQPITQEEAKAEEGDFEWDNENGKYWYRPNDLFRVKVRGMAPKVSEGALVPPEWIELAYGRWKEHENRNRTIEKPLRLGLDVAGMGRDNSAFCFKYGNYVAKFEKIHGHSADIHMQVVGKTKSILQENTDTFNGKYAQAFIDTIGEGAGVFSRLVELKSEKGGDWIHVHSCKGSFGAKDAGGIALKDATGQREFLNMRSYLYWAVRDWLNPENKSNACLPEDSELFQELTETKWRFRSDGSIQIEEKDEIKKRIKRSPDKADALGNTFWPVPDVDPSPKSKRNLSGFFH